MRILVILRLESADRRYAEALHLVMQRGRLDAEDRGGSMLVAVRTGQDVENDVPLELKEGLSQTNVVDQANLADIDLKEFSGHRAERAFGGLAVRRRPRIL